MTTSLPRFTFAPGLNLRTLTREGAPWFIAKDVCDVLGLKPKHLRDTLTSTDLSLALSSQHLGAGLPNRGMLVINESGLYALIMRSRKPEAQAFRQWVTGTVLPAIRKDGGYVAGQEKVVTGEMSEAELMARAVQVAVRTLDRLTAERDAQVLQNKQTTKALAVVSGATIQAPQL